MESRITSVILDFGGVLTLPQDPVRAARMAELCGLPLERFREEYPRDRLELDRGTLSSEAYWRRMLTAGGVSPTAGLLERLVRLDEGSWVRINPRTLAWSRELRAAGFHTAILSNMPPRILQIMRAEPSLSWMGEFTVALFSCDVKLIKPEPAFYRLCLKGLKARPEECVFFDDNEDNVRAGAALGIASYVFRSAEEAARQIAELSAGIPVASLREKEAC